MEEHVKEELVIVEADAVGDPWAMVVHLEDAAIALGAVMAPVGLRLVAPLADTHTTIALAFNRGSDSHNTGLLRWRLTASASLLLSCLAVTAVVKWTSGRVKVLEILMDHFFWLPCLFFNQRIRELLATTGLTVRLLLLLSPLLLLLEAALRGRLLEHGYCLFASRRVSTHVPLFVLRDVARIRRDRPHDRDDKHAGCEGEEAGKGHGLLTLILLSLLIVSPARFERDFAIVLRDGRVQVELG